MNEISFLYTAGLRGDLHLLPRLYTFIKTLRGEFNPVQLLDLGDACTPESWHCAATGGRSMLIALDGMGFTAANASALDAENYTRLLDQVTLALVTEQQPQVRGDCVFALQPTAGDGHLCVILTPAASTHLADGILYLQNISAGQIGVVRVSIGTTSELLSAEIRDLPPGTAPAPTIAGVVDFVIGEARYYQKRQNDSLT